MIRLDDAKYLNRLAYLLATIAAFIVFISIITYIVENKFLVEHITVTGNMERVTKDQLLTVAKEDLHGTMFTLNIDELQYEFKKIPWVKSVSVSRQFPHSITVSIIEYNAVAHYGNDGNFVSPDGKVFLGVINDPSLPIFYVPEHHVPELLKVYNAANTALLKELNSPINQVKWLGAGIVKIQFANNLQMVLCGPDYANKIDMFAKYFTQISAINPKLNYVNMCYKDAVAINSSLK